MDTSCEELDDCHSCVVVLHDAAEAYTGDIVTPLKRMLPGLGTMETAIMDAIHARFRIDMRFVNIEAIKRADETLLTVEAKRLFRTPPIHDWTDAFDADPLLGPMHVSTSPSESQVLFLIAAGCLGRQNPTHRLFA